MSFSTVPLSIANDILPKHEVDILGPSLLDESHDFHVAFEFGAASVADGASAWRGGMSRVEVSTSFEPFQSTQRLFYIPLGRLQVVPYLTECTTVQIRSFSKGSEAWDQQGKKYEN
jgi:hypothetical protein